MAPLILALGAASLAYAGYMYSKKTTARFVGDLAQVGDDVQVSVNSLMQDNGAIVDQLIAAMPKDTAFVLVNVKGGDKERVQGPVVAFGNLRVPAAVGSFVVFRVHIDKVIRSGKQATAATGPGSTFTGERRNFYKG